VTSPGKKLPKDVIANWPEVFGEVNLNVMPLRYLHAVLINFKDGKTWEIRITSKTKTAGWDSFQRSLSELVKRYNHRVEDIDFKLDTQRVRRDIEKETQKFLKKKKL